MNWNLISILASLIGGGLITYLVALWQMKRNKISHLVLKSFDIGRGLRNVFPAFRLSYNNEELDGYVRVLSGCFINDCRNDISTSEDYQVIKLILPKSCRIKDINVSTSSKEEFSVSARVDLSNKNIIVFSLPKVFKSKEYFKYSSIYENPEDIRFIRSKIKIEHRIPNVSINYNPSRGSILFDMIISRLANNSFLIFFKFIIFVNIILLIAVFIYSYITDSIIQNIAILIIFALLIFLLICPLLFVNDYYRIKKIIEVNEKNKG